MSDIAAQTADDLARFIADRLDEEELRARAATDSPWRVSPRDPFVILEPYPIDAVGSVSGPGRVFTGQISSRGRQAEHDIAHIVAWQPARVLAFVAAGRAILAEHQNVNDGDCGTCVRGLWGYPTHGGSRIERWPCPTVRAFGAIWAGHPEYREDWKP